MYVSTFSVHISWTNAIHFSFYLLDKKRITFFNPPGKRARCKKILLAPEWFCQVVMNCWNFPYQFFAAQSFPGSQYLYSAIFWSSFLGKHAVYSLANTLFLILHMMSLPLGVQVRVTCWWSCPFRLAGAGWLTSQSRPGMCTNQRKRISETEPPRCLQCIFRKTLKQNFLKS